MKIIFPALISALSYGAFAQADPPPPAGYPEAETSSRAVAMQENDLMTLAGAPWSESKKLVGETNRVIAAVAGLLTAGRAAEVNQAIDRSNGTDLLAQALYRALIAAADRGVVPMETLRRFQARIGGTGDPLDLPAMSRSWISKTSMQRNLAERIVMIDPNAEPYSPRKSPTPRSADGASGPRGGQADGVAKPTIAMTDSMASGGYFRTVWIGSGLVVFVACWLAIRRLGRK